MPDAPELLVVGSIALDKREGSIIVFDITDAMTSPFTNFIAPSIAP